MNLQAHDTCHGIVIFMIYTESMDDYCGARMNTPADNTSFSNSLVPLQLFACSYGHAALLDADGNELPITDSMIRSACEEAMDALYSFIPQKQALQLPE